MGRSLEVRFRPLNQGRTPRPVLGQRQVGMTCVCKGCKGGCGGGCLTVGINGAALAVEAVRELVAVDDPEAAVVDI